MRPTSVTLGAVGFSPWVPVNYIESWFGIGLGVYLSSNGSLTYSVQHTLDDIGPQASRQISAAMAGTTTVTITDTGAQPAFGHGLSVNDSVVLSGTGIVGAGGVPLDGTYAVATVVDQQHYTVVAPFSATASSSSGANLVSLRVLPHATLVNQTARADGNYQFPVRAIRLSVSAWAAGYVTLDVLQGHGSR